MGKTISIGVQSFEFMRENECFFSTAYENRGELFEGLSIWEEEKYRKLQGSYPVIFLSFANIKGATIGETKQGIRYALEKLYGVHRYVRDGKEMTERDRLFF